MPTTAGGITDRPAPGGRTVALSRASHARAPPAERTGPSSPQAKRMRVRTSRQASVAFVHDRFDEWLRSRIDEPVHRRRHEGHRHNALGRTRLRRRRPDCQERTQDHSSSSDDGWHRHEITPASELNMSAWSEASASVAPRRVVDAAGNPRTDRLRLRTLSFEWLEGPGRTLPSRAAPAPGPHRIGGVHADSHHRPAATRPRSTPGIMMHRRGKWAGPVYGQKRRRVSGAQFSRERDRHQRSGNNSNQSCM